ncbi:centrosomal protein of 78 kDa-like [Diadema antillarum]|uniref:centrosomal protein of 78 kDa-like n=1 Tax=Diadema antillarum TaxID=105358 RepID=UPI003A8696C9
MASMIESVKARRRGAQDFEGYYSQLCALQDSCPLSAVRAHLADGVLDLNADRIRQHDWMPILNALRINRSLQFIGIRSFYQQSGKLDGRSHQPQLKRPPPIRSRDVTHRLSLALRECISSSEQLQHVELQGLLLREKNIAALCKGLAKTRCLQHLSLESCRIGDAGVESLYQCIRNAPTLVSLNLTATGLTWKSAELLAKLIKHQATRRHTEAWKDSLRYRRPDLDRMPGIRRITVNNNSLINDRGALVLAEALKDDLWLKALDMQHCGLSNLGAKAFLDALHQNTSIVVLDLRKNPLIDRDLLKAVIEQVMINSGGQELEYKWLRARSSKDSTSKLRFKRRGRPASAQTRKSAGRSRSGSPSKSASSDRAAAGQRSRSKSTSNIFIHTSNSQGEFQPAVTRPGPGFVPWRTAARACHRSQGMLPIGMESPTGSSTPSKPGGSSVHVHVGSSLTSSEADTSVKDTVGTLSTQGSASVVDDSTFEARINRKMKDLQIEVEELRRRLYIESRARSAADARIVELEVENSRLKHQIQLLEARGPTSPLRKGRKKGAAGGEDDAAEASGEDEALLDSIEESFQKFHAFLDLLRDAGLGQLCTLVGMSPEDIGHPLVKSILKNHQPSSASNRTGAAELLAAPIVFQPGNVVYPSQPAQAPVTGAAFTVPSGSQGIPYPMASGLQGANQMPPGMQLSNQMPYAGITNVQPPPSVSMPLGIPSSQNAYTPTNYQTMQTQLGIGPTLAGPPGGVSAMQQVPVTHQTGQPAVIINPPLINQPPSLGIHPAPQVPRSHPVSISTAPHQASSIHASRVSSVPVNSTLVSHSAPSRDVPSNATSSTEGVFTPAPVQMTTALHPDSRAGQTSSGTSITTVIARESSNEADVDARNDHSLLDTVENGAPEQALEPDLPKVSDSSDFDVGNVKQMTELQFADSTDSTPRIPEAPKDIDGDSPRVGSATPTKGMGSPTESDHSARGSGRSSRDRSPSPDYSEDFEGGGDEDEEESEIEEDLFKGSEGSLPGLSSDEDF